MLSTWEVELAVALLTGMFTACGTVAAWREWRLYRWRKSYTARLTESLGQLPSRDKSAWCSAAIQTSETLAEVVPTTSGAMGRGGSRDSCRLSQIGVVSCFRKAA